MEKSKIFFNVAKYGAWETGKPGISYINENSFSRWSSIEKLDGLATLGLQKLSETVRDYTSLILTSQTSTREVQSLVLQHET